MRAPVQKKLSSTFSNVICTVFIALSFSACPDPEGKYDAFNDRYTDRKNEILEAREMEMPGGMAGGGEMMGGVEEQLPIPQITSGSFLFGLAPNLNVDKPMVFVADVQIEVNEDGSAGQIISLNLDPRTCVDLNVSAGEAVVFMPDSPSIIDAQSNFSADFGRQIVAGTANCISGSLIEAEIQLDGKVVSEDSLCGEMNGMLFRPYPADLGYSEFTMERSTFAAIRLQGDEDLSTITVPKNCGDLDPDMMTEAEGEE